jgi:hypothetical protein
MSFALLISPVVPHVPTHPIRPNFVTSTTLCEGHNWELSHCHHAADVGSLTLSLSLSISLFQRSYSQLSTLYFIHKEKNKGFYNHIKCNDCYILVLNFWRLRTDSHTPCRSHAVPQPWPCHSPMLIHTCHAVPLLRPCRGLERSLSERHIRGMAGERHGNSMTCVNQTRTHCVNQMGKTQAKPLAERHGICESALRLTQMVFKCLIHTANPNCI